jgi:hypothetical protein
MRLLSTDITKVKSLSLKDIALSVKAEYNVEEGEYIQPESAPTAEEIAYSNLVAINPALEELVSALSLVSPVSKQRIRVVAVSPNDTPLPEINREVLYRLAQKVFYPDRVRFFWEGSELYEAGLYETGRTFIDYYSKEEVVERIMNFNKVTQERAERGLELMLQEGVAIETPYAGMYAIVRYI